MIRWSFPKKNESDSSSPILIEQANTVANNKHNPHSIKGRKNTSDKHGISSGISAPIPVLHHAHSLQDISLLSHKQSIAKIHKKSEHSKQNNFEYEPKTNTKRHSKTSKLEGTVQSSSSSSYSSDSYYSSSSYASESSDSSSFSNSHKDSPTPHVYSFDDITGGITMKSFYNLFGEWIEQCFSYRFSSEIHHNSGAHPSNSSTQIPAQEHSPQPVSLQETSSLSNSKDFAASPLVDSSVMNSSDLDLSNSGNESNSQTSDTRPLLPEASNASVSDDQFSVSRSSTAHIDTYQTEV